MKEKIKEIMSSVFGIKNVSDDISQTNCESWDSLKHLNLIVELEDTFNVSFEPDEIAVMISLNDITKILQRKNN
jgi:acyl carrier protein